MKFYCRAKAQEKQHFGKSHFYCRRFFPGNAVTIILDNYPPSTLQGVGLGGRKNPRIIVGENSCHFGASYFRSLITWPFFSQEFCRKAHTLGSEDPHTEGGKIAENRTLTDVDARYFAVNLESPQMWVWPQLPFGGSPRSPPLQLEDPSLTTALPSPPSPSLFPPTPLALFAMLGEGAAQAGVGEGSLSRKGWRARAVQAALGSKPTSGGPQ